MDSNAPAAVASRARGGASSDVTWWTRNQPTFSLAALACPAMARRYDTVSLLSDLGLVDETVGVLHAVLRDAAPHAHVIDLTHQVPVHDVRAGSLALARAAGHLPSGVVVAAVDTAARRPVAIQVAGGEGVLLGPDNGLLAAAVAMTGGAERAVVLDRDEYHLPCAATPLVVRDILVAAAAHLCNGVDLADLGTAVEVDSLLPGVVPLPRDAAGGGLQADVLWVDRYGNCQLNVGPDDLAPWGHAHGARVQITLGDASAPVVRVGERALSADGLGAGSIGLVVDHTGMLALALDHRSAAQELGLVAGDQVAIAPLTEGQGAAAVRVELRR